MLHPFYLVLSVHFPHLFRNDGSALLELELPQFFADFLSFWQDLSPVEKQKQEEDEGGEEESSKLSFGPLGRTSWRWSSRLQVR